MLSNEEREIVRERLEQIAEANGGVLLAEHVVADARKKTSPLHALPRWKGWDLKHAAMQYWLEQARDLIRSVRVVVTTESTIIRAPCYVRDPSQNSDEQGYITIASLRNDEDRAREVLVMEFERVAAILRRAREVAAALGMKDDVERLVTGVVGLRQLVMERAAATQ